MLQFKESFKTPKSKVETNGKQARLAAAKALISGVQSGAQQIESALPSLLDKALDSTVWSWPRPTIRENGTIAGGTRSITDTGRLKASGRVKVKFLQTKTLFTIAYSAPYATLVHEGGYVLPYGDATRNPTYIPGRPWISAVLSGNNSSVEYLDIESFMATSIANEFS